MLVLTAQHQRRLRIGIVLLVVALAVGAKLHRSTLGGPAWVRVIEGWFPSFAYSFGLPLLAASIPFIARHGSRTRWTLYAALVVGALASELIQAFQRGQTFAQSDMVAIVIGGSAGLAIEWWIETRLTSGSTTREGSEPSSTV